MTNHEYTSTACHHGWHERCRKTCKFCGNHCMCACHDGPRDLTAGDPIRQP